MSRYTGYTSPRLRSTYSHPVSVNALSSVVSITTLEESTPSCPIFFAITKQVTVVDEPSMIRIAISSSLRNPNHTAAGRKSAQNPISLINEAVTAAPALANAFRISKAAPMAISPIGVATPATLDTIRSSIRGMGSLHADHKSPAVIPRMIGFVTTPFKVFTAIFSPDFSAPGFVTERTSTAITLYSGTLPMIISGAIPESP